MRRTPIAVIACVATSIAFSVTAQADPDAEFESELHAYGVYGPRDYNAWIGKIACKRMHNNVDHDAYQSAKFISGQLGKATTTAQTSRFLGVAINSYCPDKRAVLDSVTAGE